MNAFSFEIDTQGICIVIVDASGERNNKFAYQSILQLEELLKQVESKKEIKAGLFIGGKEDGFISGLDVNDYLNITSIDEGRMFSLRAQEILDRLQNSGISFIAAIHGACLGIGLEVALACTYRIATSSKNTVLGFPEVGLGLIPMAGGTQRLPRLIGIPQALDMLIAGENVDSIRAKEIGIVDEIVPDEILLDVGKKRALEISLKKIRAEGPRSGYLKRLIAERNPLGRKMLFDRARKKMVNEIHEYHLAPAMALEAVEVGMNSGFKRGLHVESAYFGELVVSDLSSQLMGMSLAKERLMKDSLVEGNIKPKTVGKIGVVGVGSIGSQIASLAADCGITVRMKDNDEKTLGSGMKACYDHFRQRHANNNSATRAETVRSSNLISGTTDYSGFRRADLVVESLFEDLELKQRTLEEIESVTGEECIVATSTLSLPVAQIAARSKRPGNVIGMRFFSPVQEIELIEVIRSDETSDGTTATAVAFAKRLGKIPIVVKDGVGFYTTRILHSYINEAMCLLSEGAAIDDVDEAMIEFGFPSGPLMLLDEMGFNLYAKIADNVYEAFGERLQPPLDLEQLIQDGRAGRKNGKGFYKYNGETQRVDKSVYNLLPFRHARESFPAEEIQERLSLAMINEAALALEEGIIRSPSDGDAGAVLGLGFPSFLGGPFRYVDLVGADMILNKLESLAVSFRPRFIPAEILRDVARRGKGFYTR